MDFFVFFFVYVFVLVFFFIVFFYWFFLFCFFFGGGVLLDSKCMTTESAMISVTEDLIYDLPINIGYGQVIAWCQVTNHYHDNPKFTQIY